jgi:hypothetical protein
VTLSSPVVLSVVVEAMRDGDVVIQVNVDWESLLTRMPVLYVVDA